METERVWAFPSLRRSRPSRRRRGQAWPASEEQTDTPTVDDETGAPSVKLISSRTCEATFHPACSTEGVMSLVQIPRSVRLFLLTPSTPFSVSYRNLPERTAHGKQLHASR